MLSTSGSAVGGSAGRMGKAAGSPRLPLKGSFKGDINIDVDVKKYATEQARKRTGVLGRRRRRRSKTRGLD